MLSLFFIVIPNANLPFIPNVCRRFVRKPMCMAFARSRQRTVEGFFRVAAIRLRGFVALCVGKMSWEALSWAMSASFAIYQRTQAEQHIELLWSGPSPANQIPARRIDQELYDLIANAKHEILMVTFAAAKIERLTGELWKAAKAGVKVRLILEFEESSEGQLIPNP